MRAKLVIWGASGHARVVADILRLAGQFEIVGLLDDVDPKHRVSPIADLMVLGDGTKLDELKRSGVTHVLVAIGDCSARSRLAELARNKGLQLARAVHPQAVIAHDAQVGEGTVIAAGAVVNSGANIGANVIINTGATVDHECNIAAGAHIGPGVRLGGRVAVGEGTWIGIGATVIDRIQIGAYTIIGAGAVVTKEIPANVVAYGVPARVIRKMEEHKNRAQRSRE